MLTTLLLAGLEKVINLALTRDTITQAHLHALSGKILRVSVQQPLFTVDILFNDDHLRLEPAIAQTTESPFETNQTTNPETTSLNQPDCTLTITTLVDLLALLTQPADNIPLDGDYNILIHCQELLASFEPSFGNKLQPFFGTTIAEQINTLIDYLKNLFSPAANKTMPDGKAWLYEDNTLLAKQQQINQLKQQLHDLKTDVEREQTKLNQLLAEQANLSITTPHTKETT